MNYLKEIWIRKNVMSKIKKILTNQQQIENNKDFIMKWYNKEDYYNFKLEIWN